MEAHEAHNKILFVYQDGDTDSYKIESLWATKEEEYYKIDNIPFFIKNIACGDIVSVEEENGALYFDDLMQRSGNSTVRILFKEIKDIEPARIELLKLGCFLELSHIPNLLAVDIPKSLNYNLIKHFLDDGEDRGIWEYQEACLGFK